MADQKLGACEVVGKGGVGESGASSMVHHVVEGKTSKNMVVRNVDTSLCGNTGAVAVLIVNGVPMAHGIISGKGQSIVAEAAPGDHVVAIVHTIPLFNDIVCIRLGELEFTLESCELVG